VLAGNVGLLLQKLLDLESQMQHSTDKSTCQSVHASWGLRQGSHGYRKMARCLDLPFDTPPSARQSSYTPSSLGWSLDAFASGAVITIKHVLGQVSCRQSRTRMRGRYLVF
jgi:hypothetical protein